MALFRNPEKMGREEIVEVFSSGQADEICTALVAMAYYDEDWKWSQDQCLHFLEHPDLSVRAVAASCLGDIARRHHQLDKAVVESVLKRHLHDETISGQVQDALDDMELFLKN